MSTKLVTPIQAIALASLARKVNGDKAFTDIQGEPCGPRALLANRVNTETMAKVVELALQGRFETMDTAKNALVQPLRAPQLANGRLTTKYIDVFPVKVAVDIDEQG